MKKMSTVLGIALAVVSITVLTEPASHSSGTQWYQDAAGTIYTGGTRNSTGAIANAIDIQGYRVFIPTSNAPYVQP